MIASRPYPHPSYAVGTDTASDRDARIVRELRQEIRDLDRERAGLLRAQLETPEGEDIYLRGELVGDAEDLRVLLASIAVARSQAVDALQLWGEP